MEYHSTTTTNIRISCCTFSCLFVVFVTILKLAFAKVEFSSHKSVEFSSHKSRVSQLHKNAMILLYRY